MTPTESRLLELVADAWDHHKRTETRNSFSMALREAARSAGGGKADGKCEALNCDEDGYVMFGGHWFCPTHDPVRVRPDPTRPTRGEEAVAATTPPNTEAQPADLFPSTPPSYVGPAADWLYLTLYEHNGHDWTAPPTTERQVWLPIGVDLGGGVMAIRTKPTQSLDSASNHKCVTCGRGQLYTFDRGWICPECSGRYAGRFSRAPTSPSPETRDQNIDALNRVARPEEPARAAGDGGASLNLGNQEPAVATHEPGKDDTSGPSPVCCSDDVSALLDEWEQGWIVGRWSWAELRTIGNRVAAALKDKAQLLGLEGITARHWKNRAEAAENEVERLEAEVERISEVSAGYYRQMNLAITAAAPATPTLQDASHVPPMRMLKDAEENFLHRESPSQEGRAGELRACPFCGTWLLKRERSAFHPDNGCIFYDASGDGEIDESYYKDWNTREKPSGEAGDDITVPREVVEVCATYLEHDSGHSGHELATKLRARLQSTGGTK